MSGQFLPQINTHNVARSPKKFVHLSTWRQWLAGVRIQTSTVTVPTRINKALPAIEWQSQPIRTIGPSTGRPTRRSTAKPDLILHIARVELASRINQISFFAAFACR